MECKRPVALANHKAFRSLLVLLECLAHSLANNLNIQHGRVLNKGSPTKCVRTIALGSHEQGLSNI